uniref:Uncharacterized protein n=1 Tax=Ascaris lumbricoides TaxID=6252 RepID=A0A9J2PIQ4_ASCLU
MSSTTTGSPDAHQWGLTLLSLAAASDALPVTLGYVQLMDASSSCIGEASSLASFKNDEADFKASLQSLSKEELIQRICDLSSHVRGNSSEETSELQEQLQAARRRENLAVLRLAVKEKQLREVMAESEWMHDKSGEGNKAEDSLMDHVIGAVFSAMRSELRNSRKEAKSAKLELRAIKGQPGNAESKKLAAKCKNLEEQLAEAKATAHRIARLETLLAYSQKTVDGLRRKQRDMDDVVAEHDEEMSRLQAQLVLLQEENARLRESVHAAEADAHLKRSSASGAVSRTQPSIVTVDQHDAEQQSNFQEDKAAEEMVMVSSPEMDLEESDGQRRSKRARLNSPTADCTEEVIAVSSPEQDGEADEVLVVSSPETSFQHTAVSDDSD